MDRDSVGNRALYRGTFCVPDAVRIPHEGAEMSGRSTVSKFIPLLLRLAVQREYASTLATSGRLSLLTAQLLKDLIGWQTVSKPTKQDAL